MIEYKSKFRELGRYATEGAKLEVDLRQLFLRGLLPRYTETIGSNDLYTIR